MNKRNCKSCGHVWINRVDKPKKCPNCFKRITNGPQTKPSSESLKPDENYVNGIPESSLVEGQTVDTIYNKKIKIIKPNGI